MTDQEIDERVARECFGWIECSKQWDSPNGVCWDFGGDHGGFSPTTDARDAERVWDWLLEKRPEGLVSVNRDGLTKCSSVSINSNRETRYYTYADVTCWKRALCLAALEVAADGKWRRGPAADGKGKEGNP